jgi:hypothetical protein
MSTEVTIAPEYVLSVSIKYSMEILGFKLFIGNHIKVTYKYQKVFILEIITGYIVT